MQSHVELVHCNTCNEPHLEVVHDFVLLLYSDWSGLCYNYTHAKSHVELVHMQSHVELVHNAHVQ